MLGIILFVVLFAVVFGVIASSLKSAGELRADKDRVESKERVVTVGQYIHLIDAQFAQMRLESEGIEVYLGDDNLILMDPLYSLAIGGVRIQVRSSDALRARELLELKPGTTTEEPAEKYQGAGDPCPKCGSHDTYPYRGASGIFSLILAFLLASVNLFLALVFLAPAPWGKRMYCFECKHRWKAPIRKTPDKDSKEEWQKRMDKTLKAENKHWK
ncbi:MAG TPA: hypothetical protein VJC37_01860 [Planctomycetota bacterium]|nr:hypothetical protein [Planctomycetota bacterium]